MLPQKIQTVSKYLCRSINNNFPIRNTQPDDLQLILTHSYNDLSLRQFTLTDKRLQKLRTQRIPSGSSPLIGSSKIKMSGFANKALLLNQDVASFLMNSLYFYF